MAGQVWNRCTETRDTTSLQLPFFKLFRIIYPLGLLLSMNGLRKKNKDTVNGHFPVRNGYLVTVGARANVHRNHARLIEDEGEGVRAYGYTARPKLRPLR